MSFSPPADKEKKELRFKVKTFEERIKELESKNKQEAENRQQSDTETNIDYSLWPLYGSLKELRDAQEKMGSKGRYFVRDISLQSVLSEIHTGDWRGVTDSNGEETQSNWTELPDYEGWPVGKTVENNRTLRHLFSDSASLSIEEFDRLTYKFRYNFLGRRVIDPLIALSVSIKDKLLYRNAFILYQIELDKGPFFLAPSIYEMQLFWSGSLDVFQRVLEAFDPYDKTDMTLLFNDKIGYSEVITA